VKKESLPPSGGKEKTRKETRKTNLKIGKQIVVVVGGIPRREKNVPKSNFDTAKTNKTTKSTMNETEYIFFNVSSYGKLAFIGT